MEATKNRIKKIVEDYKKLFPEEYAIAKQALEMKRSMTKDQFASVEESGNEMRGLYEIPETLNTMLTMNLGEEDITWLKTGGKNNVGAGRWFARTFREFALPEYI